MNLISSKTKIIIILSIFLSILIFFLTGFFSYKSKQMILNNRISTLNFNYEYFKDLEYFNDMYTDIQNNSGILEQFVKNTFDFKKVNQNNYVINYYNFLDPEIKTLIMKTNSAQGVWVQINPYFIDKHTLKAVSAWYIRKTGKYQRVDDKPRKLTKEEDSWYFDAVNAKKPVWSDIYVDPDIHVSMITYSIPVYNDNAFIGVVGMDISLQRLDKLVNKIKSKYKDSDVLLIDSKQDIIVSSSDNSINYFKDNLSSYRNGIYKIFLEPLEQNEKGFITFKQNGTDKTGFYSHLPNRFSYILIIPNSELLSGYNNYLFYILAISTLLIVGIILILIKLISTLLNPFQKMEKRLAYIMDNTWNEISIIDSNTFKYIYLNSAALKNLGYTLNEAKNLTLLSVNTTYTEDEAKVLLNPLITGEQKSVFIESVKKRKDGSTYRAEIQIQYFKDENPPIFVALTRDISERKQVEKLKNEFISTVSHELRTPLTAIRGSLGLVLSGFTGDLPDEAKEFIDIAHHNSARLIELINDILDFEKITAGKMEFKLASTKLMPIIEQTIKDNEPYAQQHNVSFNIIKTLPEVKVNIDPDRFIQVLTNLLSNAAKFSEANKPVEISILNHNNLIRIAVTNYGSEIPEEYKDKIFQKFIQVDSSDTRKKGGTGLGLSISKAIVEKLSGNISFETGNSITTFFVDLPE